MGKDTDARLIPSMLVTLISYKRTVGQVWAPRSQKYLVMPHRKFIILRGSREYMQEHL